MLTAGPTCEYAYTVLNTLMRILVTAPTDSHVIDSIMWYCWAHEKDGISFCTGNYIVHEGKYRLWRIYCEPNKYVDWLLLQYSDWLVVY